MRIIFNEHPRRLRECTGPLTFKRMIENWAYYYLLTSMIKFKRQFIKKKESDCQHWAMTVDQ